MNSKTLAFILVIISILMFLALLTQFKEIQGILSLLTENSSSREKGQVFGQLLYYVVHIALMIFLFIKGKNKLKPNN